MVANGERQRDAATLTKITVKGFKSFRDAVEVPIRPLTLLAGANSAGKSSLLQPLLLMKQTFEAPFDPGPLLLDGPLVKVEEAHTLFWRGKSKTDIAKSFTVATEGSRHDVQSTFSMSARGRGAELTETFDRRTDVHLRSTMSPEERARAVKAYFPAELRSSLESRLRAVRERAQYGLGFDGDDVVASRILTVSALPELLLDLIHLPGLRGNPERAYRLIAARERYPGPFQAYTASVLLAWREQQDGRLAAVGEDLKHLGLAWKVDARPRGDTAVEVHIARLPRPQQGGAQDMVNIADIGFGASQVLPVVVALQAARAGTVLHIEQPELHLHPRAQGRMADLLVAAAKRNAIVIVETHSSILLRAIQLVIARDGFPADRVALSWFERDDDGISTVRNGTLDAAGAYGDWPVDFADVELEVEREYIEAAFERAG